MKVKLAKIAIVRDCLGERKRARTCSNNVVHNEHFLTLGDGALLHLEVIGAVLLHVFGSDARTRQLALLTDGDEAGTELQGERWAEKEAAGVKANDDIGLDGRVVAAKVQQLQLQGVEQRSVDLGVKEPWHNIQEVDTGDGKVGKAADRLLEAYLCTGEFGGGGGGGGGLSSRGMVGRS